MTQQGCVMYLPHREFSKGALTQRCMNVFPWSRKSWRWQSLLKYRAKRQAARQYRVHTYYNYRHYAIIFGICNSRVKTPRVCMYDVISKKERRCYSIRTDIEAPLGLAFVRCKDPIPLRLLQPKKIIMNQNTFSASQVAPFGLPPYQDH